MRLATERRDRDDEGMRRLVRALAQDFHGNDAVALAVAGLGVAPGRTVAMFTLRISIVIGAGMAIHVAVTQDGRWWWSAVAATIMAAIIGGYVAAFRLVMALLRWRRSRRPARNSFGHFGDALQRRLAARCQRGLRSRRVWVSALLALGLAAFSLGLLELVMAVLDVRVLIHVLVWCAVVGLVIAWFVHRLATRDSDALLFVVRAVIVGHAAPSAAEGAEMIAGPVLGRVELEVLSAQELRPGAMVSPAGEAEPTPPCSGFYTCRFADWVTLKPAETVTLVSDGSGHVVGRLVDLIPPGRHRAEPPRPRASRPGAHDHGDGRDQGRPPNTPQTVPYTQRRGEKPPNR